MNHYFSHPMRTGKIITLKMKIEMNEINYEDNRELINYQKK